MTDQNLITPPPELVDQWWSEVGEVGSAGFRIALHIATQAARWGADQELEACCQWAATKRRSLDADLRATRRPEPPSLKEQALAELAATERCYPADYSTIRRALEQLND